MKVNDELDENEKLYDNKDLVATETIISPEIQDSNTSNENTKNKLIQIKSEAEEFSEKDDSSDEDIFFSAEENNDLDLTIVKKDLKSKAQKAKRKRKKQLKKKVLNESNRWPLEFEANQQLRKYWLKRYTLFSRFDEGIILDEGNLISLLILKNSEIHILILC